MLAVDLDLTLPIDVGDPIDREHAWAQGLGSVLLGLPELVGGKFFYDLWRPAPLTVNGNSAKPKWSMKPFPTGFYGLDFSASTAVGDNIAYSITLGSKWTVSCWFDGSGDFTNYPNLVHVGGLNGLQFDGGKVNGLKANALFAGGYTIGANTKIADTQLCVSWDGTTGVFAANGVIAGANVADSGFDRPDSIGGGTTGAPNGKFQSRIGDIFVWTNRALSQAEMFQWYLFSRAGYPGLVNRFGRPMAAAAGGGTTPVSASYSVPVEFLQGISAAGTLAIEMLQGINGPGTIPVDILQGIAAPGTACAEWLAGLLQGASLPVEFLGTIQPAASSVPVEMIGTVSANQTAIAEWLARASQGATTAVEWLAGLQAAGILPIEWQGVGAGPDAIWILDATGGVFILDDGGRIWVLDSV